MDGVDENNSVDEFTFDLLRRAKERSQVFSEKLKQPVEEAPKIDKILEKLEKRTSVASTGSPEKMSAPSSPTKSAKRPILKPVALNSEECNVAPARKTVSTFDALGDTIVEAKTFISDNEYSDEDVDMEDMEADQVADRPKDVQQETMEYHESDGESGTPKAETTPQLSKTLKKLAEFHNEEVVESPVHSHTPLESFNAASTATDEETEVRVSASRRARSSRLSALARTINEWEDDTTHHSVPGSRFSEVPSGSSRASLAGKSRFSTASSPASSPLSFGIKQGHTTGVRLFHNDNSFSSPVSYRSRKFNNAGGNWVMKQQSNSKNLENGGGRGSESINGCNAEARDECSRMGLKQTVLTKMNEARKRDRETDSVENSECWDEALMKSLELQGFSKKPSSPLKQIREQGPDASVVTGKGMEHNVSLSPKKTYFGGSPTKSSPAQTYFGGSPSKSSPTKTAPPPPPLPQVQSPAKSPVKQLNMSPIKQSSTVASPQPQKTFQPVRSFSPVRSPTKSGYLGSPGKNFGKTSSESSPNKPVSAIRMKFEQNVAPPKPGRSQFMNPASGRVSASKSPLKSQFNDSRVNTPDPSTLSVAERKRLFESSNFCLAPTKKPVVPEIQPKRAPVVHTSSPSMDCVKPPQDIDISSVAVVPSDEVAKVKRPAPAPPAPQSIAQSSPAKRLAPQPPAYVPPPPPLPSVPNTSTPTSSSSKRRSTSPVRSLKSEAQQVKRIKVNAPKPGKMYPSLTDIETETETEYEGHCSEVESMNDSLESQQSLGAQIETIAKACSPIRPAPGSRLPARYRPSEDFSATFACATVDALIDEALEGQDVTMGGTFDGSTILEVNKTSTPSDKRTHSAKLDTTPPIEPTVLNVDVSSSRSPSPVNQDGVLEDASYSDADTTASSSFAASPVVKSSMPHAIIENVAQEDVSMRAQSIEQGPANNVATEPTQGEEIFTTRPLVHTVSFYRKQQQQQKKVDVASALHEISEQPEISDDSAEESPIEKISIGEEIKKLEEEVERCNLSIAQASKALTWCKALIGFSDSTENIEGERILLIETQKRLALLNSIHRLKTEGALGHQVPAQVFSPSKQDVTPSCKGDMKISEIAITLRRDFFSSYRAECQYHFICLVKNKHQIEHSSLLTYESQRQGTFLTFPNEFSLQNLTPDFQINLEVYYLESAKEYLPHEAKYRINAKKDSKHATLLLSPLLTPSKKAGKGDHSKPQAHSPAGPDTVKSSSFKFCGGLSIDISSLQRTYWELDKASGPLTGGINIKVQCSAMGGMEHRGFLTLFEDVSGYGAWIRRWCRLGPAVLEFWKYPEDETECKKPPLGTLNLHECVTSKVRPAPRDVCARANTLLLVTTRAPHPNDKNTLVTSCHKGYTAVRHLISADTREERDIWCQRMNKALANLRAWDPVAKQSVDDNVF